LNQFSVGTSFTEYLLKKIPKSSDGLNLDVPSSRINDFYALYQPNVYDQIITRMEHKAKLVIKTQNDQPKRKSKISVERIHTEGLPEYIVSIFEE